MGVILLRHTRPAGADGLCYGRTDLPLAPCFGENAARLARDVPPVARVVTSPLQRCARLARHIATARGLPLCIDADLSEMDFGQWEGQPWDAIPRAGLDAWAADLLGARPHGGESVAMLRDRALRALARHAAPGTLIVTHHGVIKTARSLTMGQAGWDSSLGFGDWTPFDPQVLT